MVTIEKYNVITCLFHSVFGLLTLMSLAGGIMGVIMGKTIVAIVAFVVVAFLWAATWLNANDSLKKSIYTNILIDHLKSQDAKVPAPVLARFFPSQDYIECLGEDGIISCYTVEFLMEKLLLYIVKIHTRPKQDE